MSNVWNKVDENQQSNVFDMITPQQLQILAGLQYKYRKVPLKFTFASVSVLLIIFVKILTVLMRAVSIFFDNFYKIDLDFAPSVSG